MENVQNNIKDTAVELDDTRVAKRYVVSSETHKKIKIKAIELGIDNDGKLTPEMLGMAIDIIVDENINLNASLKQ